MCDILMLDCLYIIPKMAADRFYSRAYQQRSLLQQVKAKGLTPRQAGSVLRGSRKSDLVLSYLSIICPFSKLSGFLPIH